MDIIFLELITSLVLISNLFCIYLLWKQRNKQEKEQKSIDFAIDELQLLYPFPVIKVSKKGELIYSNDAGMPILAQWGIGIGENLPLEWREFIRQLKMAKKGEMIEYSFPNNQTYQFSISIDSDMNAYLYAYDVTEYRKIEEGYAKQISFDEVTELPNKVIFEQTLQAEINFAKAEKQKFGIFIFQLEEYPDWLLSYNKEDINALIEKFAKKTKEFCDEEPLVARLSENQFGVIVSSAQTPGEMASFVQELIEKNKGPYSLRDKEIIVTLTAGITFYPNDGGSVDALIRNAQLALMRANGVSNQYEFYQRGMIEQLQIKKNTITDLRKALELNQLSLYYQPQVHLLTCTMVSCEALIRWHHPEKGFISPFYFMTAAEETPLIYTIGEWVLREACTQLAEWLKGGYPKIKVGINVSAKQIFQDNFVQLVENVIKETNVPPGLIELELTESALAQDITRASVIMKELKSLGVNLALDDFGTGYSSLSYLMEFPVDKLKIDRAFIKSLETEKKSTLLTKGIIDLGHALNMHIVAEGVETKGQLEFLKKNNCHLIQGYYFSQPKPKDEFKDLFQVIWKV